MKYKKGQCKKCGEYRFIVNRTYYLCYYCNQIRLHGTPYKKKEPTGEMPLFKKIWSEREHVSEISGRSLHRFGNSDLFPNIFAHVLDKKNYPKFRNKKQNILLVHPDEHTLLDQGTIRERKVYEKKYNCSFDIFYEKKEKLKQEYNGLNKHSNLTQR